MNTKDLAYFCELVDQKNYTATAKKFGVSQPTITLAIQRLEREFGGVPLLSQPYPRAGLQITRAGQVLYHQAKIMLRQLTATRTEVVHAGEDSIRLGFSPVTGTARFPAVAEKLLQTNMLDDLVIREAGSHQLLAELRAGKIDIALLATLDPIADPELKATLLAVNPFRVIVSDHHPLAQVQKIHFADLRQEWFITMMHHYIHTHALEAYSAWAQFTPQVVYRTAELSLLRALVRRNVGVSLLAETAIPRETMGIHVLTLTDRFEERSYMYLVTRRSYVPTKRQAFFLSLFQTD
ncbi:LysR family transcriptional regulator [Levilactobacillus zymae]|uniref:LysR family transcriptional regulator n=1 Tax=Levilactobacillus zymae TaxID=267363 RepID=UPI003FCC607B